MRLGDDPCLVPLGGCRGKAIEKIEASSYEGILNVDVALEGGVVLELSFSLAHFAAAAVVEWKHGDSSVLRRASFKRPKRRIRKNLNASQ